MAATRAMPEAFDASGSSDAHDTTRTSLARPPVDRKANADRMDRSGQRRNELLGSKTDEDHEGTVIPGSAKECLRADARTPMTFDILCALALEPVTEQETDGLQLNQMSSWSLSGRRGGQCDTR